MGACLPRFSVTHKHIFFIFAKHGTILQTNNFILDTLILMYKSVN